VENNSDKKLMYDPLWRNMGILTKKISYDGFSSFILKPFNYLDDSVPALRDAIIQNPPLYLSGKVHPFSALDKKSGVFTPEDLYVADAVMAGLPGQLKQDVESGCLKILSFSPNHCSVSCTVDSAAVITYLQAHYPGWRISVDGTEVPVITSNLMYLSALVPAGKHIINFSYRNPLVKIVFIISASVFFLLLAALVVMSYRKEEAKPGDFT
jgi:hypothetical protein